MSNMQNRRSIRLPGYDYRQAGMYFVTICVQEKECLLGEIVDGEIHLSNCGQIAAAGWHWLNEQYPFVSVDIFCVMPNHVHAIIQIHDVEQRDVARREEGVSRNAPTKEVKRKSLGRLVGAYKTHTTKWINNQRDSSGIPFWQRNYYEHIIRNQKDLDRIREYIENNPLKWKLDNENPAKTKSSPP